MGSNKENKDNTIKCMLTGSETSLDNLVCIVLVWTSYTLSIEEMIKEKMLQTGQIKGDRAKLIRKKTNTKNCTHKHNRTTRSNRYS